MPFPFGRKEPIDAVFNGFLGINTDGNGHTATSDEGIYASRMNNLRLTENGSMTKREGFKLFSDLGKRIRGIWSGMIGDIPSTYAVADNCLYRIDNESGAITLLDQIDSSDGDVLFLYYQDSLYLIDGISFYRLGNDELLATDFGYAPLIGKDWPTSYVKEINEPRNVVGRNARFTYLVTDEITPYLMSPYPIQKVVALYKNGVKVSAVDYSMSSVINAVILQGLAKGDRIELHVKLKEYSSEYSELTKCSIGTVFGAMANSNMFLLGGSEKNKFFASASVSATDSKYSNDSFSGAGSLYIPETNVAIVGDGGSQVKALCRHYDRLIIFTDTATWMADCDLGKADGVDIMKINASVGATNSFAVTSAENTPIAVSRNGIYRFTSNTDSFDECNAYKISTPVDSIIDSMFLQNAVSFYDRAKKEVLFTAPTVSTAGITLAPTTLVYNLVHDAWYTYDGIDAERYLYVGDSLAFISGQYIYVFDSSLLADKPTFSSTRTFVGNYTSNIIEFGTLGIKHLSEIEASYDTRTGDIEYEIYCDTKKSIMGSLEGSVGEHKIYQKRLASGRLKSARLYLKFTASPGQNLHGLAIRVRR